MEEKKQPTAEVGTEGVANQPEGEVKPQLTIEELLEVINQKDAEITRKEEVIQQTKAEKKRLEKLGGSKAEMDALGKRIEAQEEWLAQALDDIANRVTGDFEDTKPQRKSYSEQLAERKAKAKPEQPKPDPDAQKFLTYCEVMDLHLDYEDFESCDPLIKESLGEGRTFREGLKFLKDKMKSQDSVDVDKVVNEKLQTAVELKLKDLGLTTGGIAAPSASGSAWKDMTPEEKLLLGVQGKK